MVDKPKLDRMLSNLRSFVGRLMDLAGISRAAFLADGDKVGSAKYHLVIAIECCIDIANHIIASENFRFPRDHADSFAVLAERDVVPAEMAHRLQSMARFRNRLVHLYWDVDDALVHEYLGSARTDFESFAEAIASHPW